ncbi:SDR family NAD(P)-dependent oxidoreductase [Mangrovimicrobium sediminis]|uniref:SDR family NAD(P)-dependent oxidoreductase n=1 Tax=Mangrovimicrobium sediminis TaxID=2562682 RepID=A0A4Z0LXF9_9GAMM|nr:oxidoreductase [Haliea sp. SAOS-164]TGD71827.1 SDR family NAD(P)-dependent oxidoreductase [Haliea sp. SAOS-164]
MQKYWSLDDAGSQMGRVAVVTGANTGLGYETALALAGKGARVILACRNPERAQAARERIAASVPGAQAEVRLLDTGSLTSVRNFAEDFARDYGKLDLLINNAGIMITPHFVTEDGIEGQLGVNHLGHFLLTGLLLPALLRTPGSRVVSLYSVAASWDGIQFDDLQFERGYDARKSYAQSKLACLMFGLELNRRLQAAGQGTISLAAHPGYSKSELSRHLPAPLRLMLSVFGGLIMQSTADGALPTLYAALGEDLHGGEAIGPSGRNETRGPPVVVTPNDNARDDDQRARLWAMSEELCDFRYPL